MDIKNSFLADAINTLAELGKKAFCLPSRRQKAAPSW